MVIPPNDNNSEKYFKSLNVLNKSLALENLSMGMSSDYDLAIKNGASHCKNWKFYIWFTILTFVLKFIFFKISKRCFFLIATQPSVFL